MHLLVVAKSPVPGRVKTRLCPPFDAADAAAIAEAALADTLEAAGRCGADRVVLALDGAPGPWLPSGVQVIAQGEGDLAARLTSAWAQVGGPGLQVGMDTPQLTVTDLDEALATLARPATDAVLGCAEDGGWWAIGFRRPHPLAFLGVPTSRADTGARQLDRLHCLGLRTSELPVRRDVDTATDAFAVADSAPGTRFARAVADAVGPGPGRTAVVRDGGAR